jgi:hypothetical protein
MLVWLDTGSLSSSQPVILSVSTPYALFSSSVLVCQNLSPETNWRFALQWPWTFRHNYLQSSTDYVFSIPALFTMVVFPSLDFSCNFKEQSIKKKPCSTTSYNHLCSPRSLILSPSQNRYENFPNSPHPLHTSQNPSLTANALGE